VEATKKLETGVIFIINFGTWGYIELNTYKLLDLKCVLGGGVLAA